MARGNSLETSFLLEVILGELHTVLVVLGSAESWDFRRGGAMVQDCAAR